MPHDAATGLRGCGEGTGRWMCRTTPLPGGADTARARSRRGIAKVPWRFARLFDVESTPTFIIEAIWDQRGSSASFFSKGRNAREL